MKKSELIEVMTDAPATVWARLTKNVAWAYRRGKISPAVFALYTGAQTLPPREVWEEIRKHINNARRVRRYLERQAVKKRTAVERREYMRAYMRRYRSDSKHHEKAGDRP